MQWEALRRPTHSLLSQSSWLPKTEGGREPPSAGSPQGPRQPGLSQEQLSTCTLQEAGWEGEQSGLGTHMAASATSSGFSCCTTVPNPHHSGLEVPEDTVPIACRHVV